MTAPAPAPAATVSERWMLRPSPSREARLRLVCVPYAGGSAAVFHGWADLLPAVVEPWTLRLPGRDARMGEPPATDLTATAEEAAAVLSRMLGDEPFAFFGHSLGAFLSFEIVRALRERWGMHASLLAVSARDAPQLPTYAGTLHQLPDEAFLDVLDRKYRAIPPMIREDARMRAVYLPALRGDVTMLETYRYRQGPPLSCPVAVYGGVDDTESGAAGLAAWGELTDGGCSVTLLPGGHFFLQEQREPLIARLSQELLRTLVP